MDGDMAALPPGPRIPKLLATYQLLAQPMRYYPRWRRRYGDPFTLSAINGTVVTTGRADLIETIFRADHRIYAPFGVEAVGPVVGASSIFTLQGSAHRRERKLMMPAFHGARMRAYATAMARAADDGFVAAGDGGRLQDAMQAISLDVILRAVFGLDDEENPQGYAEAIVGLIDSVHPALLFMPFLQRRLGGVGPYARFLERFEAVDELLDAQIERRRARPGEDILSMMLASRYEDDTQMSNEQLKDELRALVVAGHETSALALSWAVDAVLRHPMVERRLRAEIDALGEDPDPEALAKLPYLDAVCKETMRRHPIVTESLRLLKEPMVLGDHELDAGLTVSPSILLAHYDPETFPEPERFDPDRFMEKSYGPFSYLPFGGGHRRCVGAAFAQFEMKIVLGRLLARYDVELRSPLPPRPVRRNITLAPHDGVPAQLTPRRGRVSKAVPPHAVANHQAAT